MTSAASRLDIRSVGMVCNIGLNALQSCASMRARVARFEETHFRDAQGESIIAAQAPEAVMGMQGYQRLAPLLCAALLDCIDTAGRDPAEVLTAVPCLIVVDYPDRPDYPPDLEYFLLNALRTHFGVPLHPRSRILTLGITGTLELLLHVRSRFTQEMNSCIVVAVDSLVNRDALAVLEAGRRLKTESNSDGVIPGEAAAALWIGPESFRKDAMAQIDGIGITDESSAIDPSQPNRGIGLAAAMRDALLDARVSLHDIDWRVGSLTGERAGFVEASTALARVQKVHKDDFLLWSPADQIGDTGAALSACMIVAATMGLAKQYSPGPKAILYCLSPRPRRASCIVSAFAD